MGLGVRGKGLRVRGWALAECGSGNGWSAGFFFGAPPRQLSSSLLPFPFLSFFLSWAYPLCGECRLYPGRGAGGFGGSVAGRGLPVWLMGWFFWCYPCWAYPARVGGGRFPIGGLSSMPVGYLSGFPLGGVWFYPGVLVSWGRVRVVVEGHKGEGL